MAKEFFLFKKQILEIKDIEETVKALEKISAANIHFLKKEVERMKDYENELKRIFFNLPTKDISHPLLFEKTKSSRKLKIVLTVEKGFCGKLLNSILDFVQLNLEKNDKFLVVGEKGRKLFKEREIRVDYFFPASEDIPKEKETRKIRDFIISQFLKEKFGEILIIYPQFKTLMIQKPVIYTFLPFKKRFLFSTFKTEVAFPIYEPSRKKILDYLIREYLELVFYQKVLETKLSEMAAKVVAMEEAGERAKNLVKNLLYQYFREKRETITKEITDLSSHRFLFK